MSRQEQFITQIENFLSATGLAETTFGRMVCNDSGFLADLRDGRSPSLRTIDRVESFMAEYRPPASNKRQSAHV